MQGMNALPMFDSGNLYLAARAVLQRIGIGMDLSAFLSMEVGLTISLYKTLLLAISFFNTPF